jgi:hypothetical protein
MRERKTHRNLALRNKFKPLYCYFLAVWLLAGMTLTACSRQEKFTREKWDLEYDGQYLKREYIVKDLMENHLHKKMSYEEIINLLGDKTERLNLADSNRIYYQIKEKWHWDIDPEWTTYLEIELDKDSCLKSVRVVKYK